MPGPPGTRHSGGIWMKAIFVDDGFGVLDPESLDASITGLLAQRAAAKGSALCLRGVEA